MQGGQAAFVKGVELHRYDLATRKDEVLARNMVSNPAFFGDQVVWWDGETLRSTGPTALPAAKSADYLAADDKTLAWVSGSTLYAWRMDWPEARPLTKGAMKELRVAGDLVTWNIDAAYVTDIRSGATYRTPSGHWFEVRGGALAGMTDLQGQRTPFTVPAADLPPLPAC